MEKKRIVYIELIRIIACMMVIFNHSGNVGFSLYTAYRPEWGSKYWIYLAISIFCKAGVYLFFMVSGAMLLGKQDSIKKWLSRILKTVIILLFWSFIYYLIGVLDNQYDFDLMNFFEIVVKQNWNFSYWYLYTYIGFLICLPFLRELVKMDAKFYYVMFMVCLVNDGIIPLINYWYSDLIQLNPSFDISWMCSKIVIYPILGYYLNNNFHIERIAGVILLWFVNVISIAICCITNNHICQGLENMTEANSQYCHSTLVIINATVIFLTCRFVVEKINFSNKFDKVILSMGNATLGIYLIHVYLEVQNRFLLKIRLNYPWWLKINLMIAALLSTICIFMLGYVIVLMMKKIPLLNKMI